MLRSSSLSNPGTSYSCLYLVCMRVMCSTHTSHHFAFGLMHTCGWNTCQLYTVEPSSQGHMRSGTYALYVDIRGHMPWTQKRHRDVHCKKLASWSTLEAKVPCTVLYQQPINEMICWNMLFQTVLTCSNTGAFTCPEHGLSVVPASLHTSLSAYNPWIDTSCVQPVIDLDKLLAAGCIVHLCLPDAPKCLFLQCMGITSCKHEALVEAIGIKMKFPTWIKTFCPKQICQLCPLSSVEIHTYHNCYQILPVSETKDDG